MFQVQTTLLSTSVEETGEKACKCIRFTMLPHSISVYSDGREDEPHITEEAFFFREMPMYTSKLKDNLMQYGVLDEISFPILRGLKAWQTIPLVDQMHYLMYVLGKRENGLQILFRCLKETQHRFPEHRRIVQDLESAGWLVAFLILQGWPPNYTISACNLPHIILSLHNPVIVLFFCSKKSGTFYLYH